ncbi:hypothetical protein DPW03_06275 [Aggregatibacter aphrophilus]|nr:hypothetical protein DPW03_06275 [Aggregatibacter aphrophilus]RDE97225.1 hypothetical protein DPW02_05045 [Aggregatibacter aphrophilus]
MSCFPLKKSVIFLLLKCGQKIQRILNVGCANDPIGRIIELDSIVGNFWCIFLLAITRNNFTHQCIR